ncbi:hypothetical protein [Deminuibacter soli]|uniref:Outer membrane protein beta-barrel domain-containing protein n=1 Tax=Deminuibacter soli TaxID=2291815 RepID=A0A3E1NJ97_9BACT|nr:hypothetical protein [Deminuibacter soli]RFM28010.1 hypothetical protein DXN05_10740 [Deminuibacter soli]
MPEDQDDIHDYGPPPSFLEDTGWAQMRSLLDTHMPVATESPVVPLPVRSRLRLLLWPALVAATLFLGLPMHTRDALQQSSIPEDIAVHAATKPGDAQNNNTTTLIDTTVHNNQPLSIAGQTSTIEPATRRFVAGEVGGNAKIGRKPVHGNSFSAAAGANNEAPPVANATRQANSADTMAASPLATSAAKITSPDSLTAKTATPTDKSKDSTVKSAAKKQITRQPLLGVALELNKTIARHSHPNSLLYQAPVFPSLKATIHINNRWGISTGVALFAPGNFKHPVTQQVPVVNLVSNLALVTTKETVDQVYYWKIPILAEYNINRNISVFGGIELAFLQKVLVNKQENFNSASDTVTTLRVNNYLLSGGTVDRAALGQSYDVRKFDPRATVGVQYHFNRFYAGVQYSQALQNSVVYKNYSYQPSKNKMINFTVGFNLLKSKKAAK